MAEEYGLKIITNGKGVNIYYKFTIELNRKERITITILRKPKMESKKKKILVVDDEPDLTLACNMLLEDNGFDVDTFNDPLIALSTFKPNYYDHGIT